MYQYLPTDSGNRKSGHRKYFRGRKLVYEIVIGVVAGLIATFVFTATGHAMGIYGVDLISHSKPTCESPQWLLQIPDNQTRATSYYYATVHTPDLTIDNKLGTAWLQWWPKSGEGSVYNNIVWVFDKRYRIQLICIINGWTRDSTTYGNTLPIGSVIIFHPNPNTATQIMNVCGRKPTQVNFPDYIKEGNSYDWKAVKMNCMTNSLALRIQDVSSSSLKMRSGRLYVSKDNEPRVGLSEIRFYYAPFPLRDTAKS